MREILFRGKLTSKNKGWSEGCLRIYPTGDVCIVPDDTIIGRYGEVHPETVGQYTGLIDKNGVKIFEGDILQADDMRFVVKFGRCGGVQNVDHEVGYVGFFVEPVGEHREELLLNGVRSDILYWLNAYKVSVVGNMHDNPEFL